MLHMSGNREKKSKSCRCSPRSHRKAEQARLYPFLSIYYRAIYDATFYTTFPMDAFSCIPDLAGMC